MRKEMKENNRGKTFMKHRNGLLFVDNNMFSTLNWTGVKCIHVE